MTSNISSTAKAPVPLSTTILDRRIYDIPISLRFQRGDSGDEDTRIQDAILPYFAMQFTTVTTPGTRLECGLYALSISYHAARNALQKPGTPEIPLIPVSQWRQWLNSNLYENACEEMANAQPELLIDKEKDKWVSDFMAEKNNLQGAALSCLLRVANFKFDTSFQLGIVVAGYRGRIDPVDKKKFDNEWVVATRAETCDMAMRNGPMLWIFNNSAETIQVAHRGYGHGTYSHWEGFAYNPQLLRTDRRVKTMYNYGVGYLVEEDIKRGVWFSTKDSSSAKTPGHTDAGAGTFLRVAEAPPNSTVPPDYRYMRSCSGNEGLVLEANIEKVKATNRMPTKNTDPSGDMLKLMRVPSTLPKVPPPAIPGKTGFPSGGKTDNGTLKEDTHGAATQGEGSKEAYKPAETTKDTAKGAKAHSDELEEGEIEEEVDASGEGGEKDPKNDNPPEKKPIEIPRGITTKDPRIDPPFRNRLLKLFRVIPPTTKAGKPSGDSLKETLSDNRIFPFDEGDFMLDLKDRGDRTARVRNINDSEGDIQLRRLQALKSPWGLPNLLPLAPRRNYMVPEEDTDAIAFAQFLDKKKEIDFSSIDLLRAGLKKMLEAKKKVETYYPELARITQDLPPSHKKYKTSCEKGEIVRVSEKGAKWCLAVNYEGFENLIPVNGIKKFDNLFWSLAPIYRGDWNECETNRRKHDRPSGEGEDDDSRPEEKKRRTDGI